MISYFYRLESSITFCADYKELQGNVVENILRVNFFAREIKSSVELQYKLWYFKAHWL